MLSVQDFASKIKSKYPEYQNVDDNTLTQKIIAKYPEYKSQVDMGETTQQTPISGQVGAKAAQGLESVLNPANAVSTITGALQGGQKILQAANQTPGMLPATPTTPEQQAAQTQKSNQMQQAAEQDQQVKTQVEQSLNKQGILPPSLDQNGQVTTGSELQQSQQQINSTLNPVGAFAGNTAQALGQGAQQAGQGVGEVVGGIQQGGVEGSQKSFGGLEDIIRGGMGAAFSPVSGAINTIPDEHIKQGVGALANAPSWALSSLAKWGAKQANPSMSEEELDKLVGQPIGLATQVGALAAAPEGMKGVPEVVKGISEIPGEVKGIPQGLVESAKTAEQDAWAKPAGSATPGLRKASDIYKNAADNGHNISETLVNNGVKLSNNVEGKMFNTADTADQIRADAGKMSSEMLRPKLEEANAITAPIPVEDIMAQAKAKIENDSSLTATNKTKTLNQLEAEGEALQKTYPNGMSLTDLHDSKITYDQNAKYSPLGDIATNNAATMNKAVADSARTALEKNAPEGIPVKDFNAELRKQFQAADYLDALNGKKAPQGFMSKIAQSAAKGAGALGVNLAGGGLFSELAGYHLGGMVENLLENLPTKIRGNLLDSLEKTNPEAFTTIKNYANK